ncbi:hypothetical protein FH609_030515 [Streptomyces sp. 3MP-14]|uniref:Nucleotide exchange factor GrpE n=1 Tax=Streptomyces mimosae TaxID=2586635 RepID=A0A5N5ZR98_9ACTN|nr:MULTISPECIES: hypothetical protein [Streptomyces]KAB8157448.1 hypothetical protein FH607_030305 [Streptomyces mimosae]KAB8172272.1 hypothetical protein FH609_030515 [Streptomyces sp. 3MP-14]
MAASSARRLRSLFGQLRHPREFRVPPPLLDPDQAAWATVLMEEIAAARALAERAIAEHAERPADTAAEDGSAGAAAGTDALLRAAIGLWRAERKLDQDGGGPLSGADLRQVRRQVNASRQALVDDGLEIQDHDGQRFASGLSLEVLVSQEEPGLTHEVVLETVRPSVYFRGKRIQMGQVIVGRPAAEPTPDN